MKNQLSVEVKKAVRKLKNENALQVGNIIVELLKANVDFYHKIFTTYSQTWGCEEIPETWRPEMLIKLPKK